MTQNVDLSKLSAKELKALLAEKEAKEREAREAQRAGYEKTREDLINKIGQNAEGLCEIICLFKTDSFRELGEFRAQMLEYGDLHRGEKNKGSFTLQNETYRIMFKTHTVKGFDERAELAEGKLREFLNTYLKRKAHKNVVDVINSLLRRGVSDRYDINLINKLYSMKDKFDNSLWHEALELFQESYSPTGTAQYLQVYKRNELGEWDNITLDIARATINEPKPEQV